MVSFSDAHLSVVVTAAKDYTVTILHSVWAVLPDHDSMLVIFTAILAVFTVRLWRDGRILQRAYIAVEPQGIYLMLNGSDLIGHIGIKNAGHLPARKLGWFINIKHSFSGKEPETFFQLESENGNIVLAPGTVATRGSDKHVSVQALLTACDAETAQGEKAKERDVFLYVWGSVHYDNGYRRRCMTKFCHRYNWKNRGRGKKVGGYEIAAKYARYHDCGNDADW